MPDKSARTSTTIGVVIVDDHELVRNGVRAVLELHDDIEILGEADSGEASVMLADKLHPDVVLMDLVLQGAMDGVAATAAITNAHPDTKVLALTSFSDVERIQNVLRAGALGCLLKNVDGRELVAAIRKAHVGAGTLAPEAADALVRAIASPPEDRKLTARERQVLKLMAKGLTNAEIAERLVLSLSTVKAHASSIIAKLDASTRTEAAAIAVRERLD